MLFLLTPPHAILWSDLPERTIDIAREHGGDLGRLDWRDTEEPHDPATVVQVALRHGEACSRGIVFPASPLIAVEEPGKLASLLEKSQESERALAPHDEVMEALMPGWIEHGRKLSADVDESVRRTIAREQEEADAFMAAPVREDVRAAWLQMGGLVL
ncbi:hypothetical protein [Brachybacterium alimentarium]|uniref:Uncharacterized protein n=1 Tax=Brachybacterium faecium (strain ATCC 43885 / DSM 4810 / JCM 11609 / LMG 19847 / NBRC 14762 / NCIMB 9860 / 6-10) TaxID=446465 RepID=C7MD58_BRAFD|nr:MULTISPECIES: hypothetical protein [Brachybacterium]ACU85515.1 hypothetical protein Bfae_16940 [Brachybacterium faecium DSM 4810]RCS71819.1 hypothetical protein CIK73_01475 [Brachybacterium alimentarium]RCS74182.1 hypothetical protein CIK68_07910 [Brachybacterium alimentarium]RCS81300.1 hypothetical protein CIK67_16120 [Brachybacterium alimentarium]